MVPSILKVLAHAIKEKRCVTIRYHGQSHIRVLEPHAIYAAENGEILMDAFQTRGYSASGRPTPFWRPFRLKKISAISLLNETFETRVVEGFDAAKPRYKTKLYAMVDDRRRSFVAPPVLAQAQGYSDDVGPRLPSHHQGRRPL
jgi:predicted DNA-binding transcriptional regulator YafY